MNKVSKILMHFLKQHFGLQRNTTIFSAKPTAFLKTIYREILKAERNWIMTGKSSIKESLLVSGKEKGNQ